VESIADLTAVSQPPIHSCLVVDLGGELDVASVPELRRRLTALILSGRSRLVLNAAALDFIDAAGIGCLVHVAKIARAEGGWIRLIRVEQRHLRLLRILRLGRMLPVHESLEDAVREG